MHKIRIGITDDQQLFLRSLSTLIGTFRQCAIVVEALNGRELLEKLVKGGLLPEILLIDVNMPVMDGVATVKAITRQYPLIRTVALSMKDDDHTIIQMIRAGCCAYLLKDIHPDELERALVEIHAQGSYNADASNVTHRRVIRAEDPGARTLSEKEKAFLKLACSDLTYKQIAGEMNLSERTIDGYRESLFEKLNVQSRVGMVLEALRRHIIELPVAER
jgi:DNA-binding NarL/FixJ family response regulator